MLAAFFKNGDFNSVSSYYIESPMKTARVSHREPHFLKNHDFHGSHREFKRKYEFHFKRLLRFRLTGPIQHEYPGFAYM